MTGPSQQGCLQIITQRGSRHHQQQSKSACKQLDLRSEVTAYTTLHCICSQRVAGEPTNAAREWFPGIQGGTQVQKAWRSTCSGCELSMRSTDAVSTGALHVGAVQTQHIHSPCALQVRCCTDAVHQRYQLHYTVCPLTCVEASEGHAECTCLG